MATEVGKGKVTVEPDTKPLEAGLNGVFSLLGGKFGKAGEVAGAKLDEGIAGQVGGSSKMLGTLMKTVSAAGPWGIAIGAGVAAAAGVTTALYKVGTTFDGVYRTIQRNTGATGGDLKALEGSFRTVASTSSASFGQVTEAIDEVQRYTGPTGKALNGLSTQFLTLSKITGTDVAGNVEAGVHALENWNISQKNAAPAMDALFVASQKSGVSFATLAGQVTKFSPVFKTMGLNFDQSVAMLASFGKTGVATQTIMMGLTAASSKLAKEEGSGGTAAAALSKAQLGLSNEQAKLSAKTKLSITDQQRLAKAQDKVSAALAAMGKAGASPTKSAAALKTAQQGLLDLQARLSAKMHLSVGDNQALAKAQNAVKTAQLGVVSAGKDIPSALAASIKSIKNAGSSTQALQIAANLFGTRGAPAMVQAIRSGKFNFDEMTKAIGTSNGAIASTAKQTATVGGSFAKLKNAAEVSVAPLGQAVSHGINAALLDTMKKLTPVVATFAKDLPGAMTAVGNALKPLQPVFANLLLIAQRLEPYVGRMFTTALGTLKDFWTFAKPALKLLGDALTVITDLLTGKWSDAWANVKKLPQDLLATLSKIPQLIEDEILQPFRILAPGVAKALDSFFKFVGRIPADVITALATFGTTVATVFTTAWSKAYGATTSALKTFWKGVTDLPGTVVKDLAHLGTSIFNAISGGFGQAAGGAASGLGSLWRTASALPGNAVRAIGNLGTSIYNALSAGFGQAAGGAAAGLVSLWNSLTGIGSSIISHLGDVGTAMYNWGLSIVGRLASGIADAAPKAAGALVNLGKGLLSHIPHSPAQKGPFGPTGWNQLYAGGKAITEQFASGINAGADAVSGAMAGLGVSPATGTLDLSAVGGVGTASSGPAVVVQNANFSTELDVEAFMRKAAWVAQTQRT